MQMTIDGFMAPTLPEQTDTLAQARADLRSRLDDGSICPCCDKYARRYRRRFNSTMSRSLIWLVRSWEAKGSEGWIDVPAVAPRWVVRSNQLPTIRWWSLAERPPNDDPLLKHSGLWRPTKNGVAFAHRRTHIQDTAVTYNGNVEAISGAYVDIVDTLGIRFNYAEMMGGA